MRKSRNLIRFDAPTAEVRRRICVDLPGPAVFAMNRILGLSVSYPSMQGYAIGSFVRAIPVTNRDQRRRAVFQYELRGRIRGDGRTTVLSYGVTRGPGLILIGALGIVGAALVIGAVLFPSPFSVFLVALPLLSAGLFASQYRQVRDDDGPELAMLRDWVGAIAADLQGSEESRRDG